MTDASSLGVEELATAYRDGRLTPTDAVNACLLAVDRYDARVGAWQAVYAKEARASAACATLELGRARSGGRQQRLPMMFGIPFGVKDLIDVQGQVTTCGSAARIDHDVATDTAVIVKNLTDAGAILLGKLKTVEFGRGGWGDNDSMGSPINPWSPPGTPPLVCGGSSSGSAASVAARMIPVAIGAFPQNCAAGVLASSSTSREPQG